MSILRIKDILDENFDTDPPNNLEAELYNTQNIMLRTFVRNTVDHTHHHLINGLPHVKNQYSILQKHMDLGTHAQIYEAAKEFHTMKFNTVELMINAFNSFYNTVTEAGLTIIQKLLPYIFLAALAPYFGPAIHHMLADTPQTLQSISWTLEAVGRYFLWKRSSKTPQQRERVSPSINNPPNTITNPPNIAITADEKQEGTSYSRSSKCATCNRKHRDVYYNINFNPTTTGQQSNKTTELPAHETSKIFYIITPMSPNKKCTW
jgi:hypothetical protein